MFDVGFWELCMVGLVSLLVIGPEKLPKVARIVGFWVGKTRHMVQSVKDEIKEELHEEELRQLIKEQQAQLDAMQSELRIESPAIERLRDETVVLEKDIKQGQRHD